MTSGRSRADTTRDDDRAAFVVEDGRYVSGLWPGDAWLIGKNLIERLPAVAAAPRALQA